MSINEFRQPLFDRSFIIDTMPIDTTPIPKRIYYVPPPGSKTLPGFIDYAVMPRLHPQPPVYNYPGLVGVGDIEAVVKPPAASTVIPSGANNGVTPNTESASMFIVPVIAIGILAAALFFGKK